MPRKKQAKGEFFVNPFSNPNIGRRTGKDVTEGKNIRVDEDGDEVFDDYWTDSSADSELSSVWSAEKGNDSRKVNVPSQQQNQVFKADLSAQSMSSFSAVSHDASTLGRKLKLDNAGNETGSISKVNTARPLIQPNSALQNFRTKKRLTYSDEHVGKSAATIPAHSSPSAADDEATPTNDRVLCQKKAGQNTTRGDFKEPAPLPAKLTAGASKSSLKAKRTGGATQEPNISNTSPQPNGPDIEIEDAPKAAKNKGVDIREEGHRTDNSRTERETEERDPPSMQEATTIQGHANSHSTQSQVDVRHEEVKTSREQNLESQQTHGTRNEEITQSHASPTTKRLYPKRSGKLASEQEASKVNEEQPTKRLYPKRSAKLASEQETSKVNEEQPTKRLHPKRSAKSATQQEASKDSEEETTKHLYPKRSAKASEQEASKVNEEHPTKHLYPKRSAKSATQQEASKDSEEETTKHLYPKRSAKASEQEASKVNEEQPTKHLYPKRSAKSATQQEASKDSEEETTKHLYPKRSAKASEQEASKVNEEQPTRRLYPKRSAKSATQQEASKDSEEETTKHLYPKRSAKASEQEASKVNEEQPTRRLYPKRSAKSATQQEASKDSEEETTKHLYPKRSAKASEQEASKVNEEQPTRRLYPKRSAKSATQQEASKDGEEETTKRLYPKRSAKASEQEASKVSDEYCAVDVTESSSKSTAQKETRSMSSLQETCDPNEASIPLGSKNQQTLEPKRSSGRNLRAKHTGGTVDTKKAAPTVTKESSKLPRPIRSAKAKLAESDTGDGEVCVATKPKRIQDRETETLPPRPPRIRTQGTGKEHQDPASEDSPRAKGDTGRQLHKEVLQEDLQDDEAEGPEVYAESEDYESKGTGLESEALGIKSKGFSDRAESDDLSTLPTEPSTLPTEPEHAETPTEGTTWTIAPETTAPRINVQSFQRTGPHMVPLEDAKSDTSSFMFKSIMRSRHFSAPAENTPHFSSDGSEDFEMVLQRSFSARRPSLMRSSQGGTNLTQKLERKLPVKKQPKNKGKQSPTKGNVSKEKSMPSKIRKGKQKTSDSGSGEKLITEDFTQDLSNHATKQTLTESPLEIKKTSKGRKKDLNIDSDSRPNTEGPTRNKRARKAQKLPKQSIDYAADKALADHQTMQDESVFDSARKVGKQSKGAVDRTSSSGEEDVPQQSEHGDATGTVYKAALNDKQTTGKGSKATKGKSRSSSEGSSATRQSKRTKTKPVAWYKNESPYFTINPLVEIEHDPVGTPTSLHIPDGSYLMVASQQKTGTQSPMAISPGPDLSATQEEDDSPPVRKKKRKGPHKLMDISTLPSTLKPSADRPTESPVQLKSILKKPTYGIHQMTGNASFASPVLPHATEVTGLDYTGTPVHFHEMTKSQTPLIPSAYKKKEVKIIPPEKVSDGIRRSQRTRVKTLDWFRNERIMYERRKSGGFVVADVISPEQETEKKKKKKAPRKKKAPKTPRRLSIHTPLPTGAKEVESREVCVMNPDSNEEVLVDCVRSHDTLRFRGPSGEEGMPFDPLIMCKALTQPAFSLGKLVIRPHQEKPMQLVRKDTMVFLIVQGKLAVTIHRTMVVMETGDVFFIPSGNVYGLKNLRDEDAKLCFFQLKG